MDLKASISEPLWAAIETSYEAANYTGAMLDAMYFLGDLIREKTGLQSDGVELVGQAFGVKKPLLKVNKLETESEIDTQKGIENLLFGLFQAIRNPRSHSKRIDNKEDADCIILFVNYLLNVIGVSKGVFSVNEFLTKVFDPSFVQSDRYAELLIKEIPKRYKLEVITEVFKKKAEGDSDSIALFIKALLSKLEQDDLSKLAEFVSEELNTTNDSEAVRITTKIFPVEFWARLGELARLRSENRFLKSIKEGEYIVATKQCLNGAFGTWCEGYLNVFTSKEDCIAALLIKLNSDKKTEQDYVFQFFVSPLLSSLDKLEEDSWIVEWAKGIINDGMKSGDKRFRDLAYRAMIYHNSAWKDSLKVSFDAFQEAIPSTVDKSEKNEPS